MQHNPLINKTLYSMYI